MELSQTTIEVIVYLAVITWSCIIGIWAMLKWDAYQDRKKKQIRDMEALLKRSDELIEAVREIRRNIRNLP